MTLLCMTLSFAAWHHEAILAFARGEIDMHGQSVWKPTHPVGNLEDIDFDLVHTRLLPQWVVERGHVIEEREESFSDDDAFATLRYALSADKNLVAIVDELETLLGQDPVANAKRIKYLLWAYNDYLDSHEQPYRLEASLRRRKNASPVFAARSYQVLEDLDSPTGLRLRMLRRADLTTAREGYLGHSSGRSEGALVMLDRVSDFAIRQVWPALHPALTERLPPDQRSVARHVRMEASRSLSPDLLALLNETAVDQLALVEVAASIHARHRCGSRFQVWGLPWNGLVPRDRHAIMKALQRSEGSQCPEVTLEEAARMLGASDRLGSTEELDLAVEELITWVAKSVAAHELQHAMDDGNVSCAGCGELSDASQEELSAYLNAFSTEGVAYVSLMQACHLLSISGAATHERALAQALKQLLNKEACLGVVPTDFHLRAQALGLKMFPQKRHAKLPKKMAHRLPLLARSAKTRTK